MICICEDIFIHLFILTLRVVNGILLDARATFNQPFWTTAETATLPSFWHFGFGYIVLLVSRCCEKLLLKSVLPSPGTLQVSNYS